MTTSDDSASFDSATNSKPGIAAAAYTTPQVNLCLRFPQPGVRVVPVLGNDDELWILVADEYDNDWNQWIVASSEVPSVMTGWFVASCGGGETTQTGMKNAQTGSSDLCLGALRGRTRQMTN